MFVNQPLKRKGTPKDSDKAASEISGEEKRSEADQLILVSDGSNSVAPATFDFFQDTASHRRQDVHLFVQAFSLAAIAACHPVKLNLESERKENENVDIDESGPKDYISEVCKEKFIVGFDSRLPDAARCSGYAHGWTEVELREVVW